MARWPTTDFGASIVSYREQALGAHTFINRARTLPDLVRGYGMLSEVLSGMAQTQVVPFGSAAAVSLDGLQRQRIRLATMDLRIAATALSRNLVPPTRNARDFSRVPGLMIEDWTS
jgi:tRNA(fMet)-specific endonuclease VapC